MWSLCVPFLSGWVFVSEWHSGVGADKDAESTPHPPLLTCSRWMCSAAWGLFGASVLDGCQGPGTKGGTWWALQVQIEKGVG